MITPLQLTNTLIEVIDADKGEQPEVERIATVSSLTLPMLTLLSFKGQGCKDV